MYYILRKYKNKGSYDIMTGISEDITLVQLVYSLGNVNYDISVFGYWIFDSNYKRALVLNRESLDMICAPSVGEEQVAVFEAVFTAMRYIWFDAYLKIFVIVAIEIRDVKDILIVTNFKARESVGNDIVFTFDIFQFRAKLFEY